MIYRLDEIDVDCADNFFCRCLRIFQIINMTIPIIKRNRIPPSTPAAIELISNELILPLGAIIVTDFGIFVAVDLIISFTSSNTENEEFCMHSE